MLGEEEDVEDERSFSAKSPLRRIKYNFSRVINEFVY